MQNPIEIELEVLRLESEIAELRKQCKSHENADLQVQKAIISEMKKIEFQTLKLEVEIAISKADMVVQEANHMTSQFDDGWRYACEWLHAQHISQAEDTLGKMKEILKEIKAEEAT